MNGVTGADGLNSVDSGSAALGLDSPGLPNASYIQAEHDQLTQSITENFIKQQFGKIKPFNPERYSSDA